MFIIGGIQKTSLVDFPGKVAAVVFTQGCNFRCGYCHNPGLITAKQICHSEPDSESVLKENFLSFLKTRIGKLDGVVISGGEPTLQSGLYDFIKEIKQMNFAVKLDTNGTNPDVVKKLLNDDMLNYIAMDIKAPLEKYPQIVNISSLSEGEGLRERVDLILKNIQESINLITNSKIDYEFRTTVVKSQLSFDDFDKIGQIIKGAKRYYLQKFVPSNILDKNLINEETYSEKEFETLCQNLKKHIEFVDYR